MKPWLSIIIPAAQGEEANLWFTLHSLLFENLVGVEILVVDNNPGQLKEGDCADIAQKFGPPVSYRIGNAVQSPYYPRNCGADSAQGDWLLFLDSHVMLQPGWSRILEARTRVLTEDGGDDNWYPKRSLVHFPVGSRNQRSWSGHYRMSIETDFWGHWGPAARGPEEPPYRIAASGIWALLTRKADWETVRGFNEEFRGYGGGEVYIHLKYWRMGGQVLMDPSVRGVHWSGRRSYPQRWEDRIRNVALAGRVVVGPNFKDRFFPGLSKYWESKKLSPRMIDVEFHKGMGLAIMSGETDWMMENALYSFDQVRERWTTEHVLTK